MLTTNTVVLGKAENGTDLDRRGDHLGSVSAQVILDVTLFVRENLGNTMRGILFFSIVIDTFAAASLDAAMKR